MSATGDNCVLGLDFGSDSVRAVVVRVADGEELSSAVANYPRWAEGKFCDPARQQFRQHPSDYLESMVSAVREAVAALDKQPNVIGIGVDTTGSSPMPVTADGTALALKDGFSTDPDAMCILWKDHTSVGEAQEINDLCHSGKFPDYTKYVGGIYSSEWYWAKILNVGRRNPTVFRAAANWVELCDWVPAVLSGVTDAAKIVRSRCAAGHKALWHPEFGGLPSREWLQALDPCLGNLTTPLYSETKTSDQVAGTLSSDWAGRFGLNAGIPIAVGAFDCHMGAVGAGIEPYSLVRVMGTSTCDILVAPPEEVQDTLVQGICGQVPGSVLPDFIGFEAGQSSFGDVFAWFERLLQWGRNGRGKAGSLLPELEKEASELPPGGYGERALDWLNGRRTPDADQTVKAILAGLHLGSTAPSIYRALIEATAYGSRAIVERFEEQGVQVKSIVAIGGIARKSNFISQVCADVMNRQVDVVLSDQACARGAAIFAATAAGAYEDIHKAKAAMLSPIEKSFVPDPEKHKLYNAIYEDYKRIGAFAGDLAKG
ncbi:ribulokinase [Cohaesibacter haloalkalitolerans]|uniref:ribulokinase n=1 Tax=Cohaesibacter haloalkalitolerans TaxID=1162980 RepID=UPI000E648CAA|nr:ribulokinase [Cohaesibacter haloalkalitolerans]